MGHMAQKISARCTAYRADIVSIGEVDLRFRRIRVFCGVLSVCRIDIDDGGGRLALIVAASCDLSTQKAGE